MIRVICFVDYIFPGAPESFYEISYIINLLLNLTKTKILQKLHILGLDYGSTSKDWLNGENTEPTLTSEKISGALLTDKSRDPRRKSTEDESPKQNIK